MPSRMEEDNVCSIGVHNYNSLHFGPSFSEVLSYSCMTNSSNFMKVEIESYKEHKLTIITTTHLLTSTPDPHGSFKEKKILKFHRTFCSFTQEANTS